MDGDRSQKNVSFDLTSQVGVLQALYAVRTSELSATDKNALRDQIFAYTKSGGDTRLREQVEEKLSQLPLSEDYLKQSVNTKTGSVENDGLAVRRKTPQFAVPEVPDHFTPDSVTHQENQPEVDPGVDKVSTEPVETPAARTPAAESSPDSLQTDTHQAGEAVAETLSSPEAKNTPAQTAEQPEAVAQDASAPAAQSPTGLDTSINRIREIKRHINNKIGNPVNLVDIDNTLGREYMSALLQAMQSVNAETGQAGATEMQSLENAFSAVLPLLEKTNKETSLPNSESEVLVPKTQSAEPVATNRTSEPASTVAPVQTSTPPAQTESPQEGLATNSPTPVPTPELQDQPSETAVANNVEASPIPVRNESVDKPVDRPVNTKPETDPTVPVKAQKNNLRETPVSLNSPQVNRSQAQFEDTETPISTSEPDQYQQTTAEATSVNPGHTSETQTTPPEQVSDKNPVKPIRKDSSFNILPINTETDEDFKNFGTVPSGAPVPQRTSAQEVVENSEDPVSNDTVSPDTAVGNKWETSTKTKSLKDEVAGASLNNQLETLDKQSEANQYKGDPLHAPEIDSGLEQLLQEWNLFKSSGLFGTGPSGREHPLYKKLAPMMVQDVAMGRFEDARPEVVQSITDYMNGWRYEQGVVYEPGETFETYLRRVIKFILTGKP